MITGHPGHLLALTYSLPSENFLCHSATQVFRGSYCSRSFSIGIRFAGFCYELFMAMRYKFNLVTYFWRPLVIDRRGGTERILNEIMAGSRQKTLTVKGGKQSCTRAM